MIEPEPAPRISVREVSDATDMRAVVAIRRQVFIVEQGVAASVDPDNIDRRAYHVLGQINDRTVGVGRLQLMTDEAQIAWVAVLPEYRRLGVGRAIMHRLVDQADHVGIRVVLLNAQTHAMRFYTHLGFRPVGEPFVMGGIEHQLMSRLRPEP